MGNIKLVVYLCVISLLHPVLCVRMHTPPSHVLCALGPFPSPFPLGRSLQQPPPHSQALEEEEDFLHLISSDRRSYVGHKTKEVQRNTFNVLPLFASTCRLISFPIKVLPTQAPYFLSKFTSPLFSHTLPKKNSPGNFLIIYSPNGIVPHSHSFDPPPLPYPRIQLNSASFPSSFLFPLPPRNFPPLFCACGRWGGGGKKVGSKNSRDRGIFLLLLLLFLRLGRCMWGRGRLLIPAGRSLIKLRFRYSTHFPQKIIFLDTLLVYKIMKMITTF